MGVEGNQMKANVLRRTIRLGQTLHGYADGHQLLSGSIKLSRQTARQMNILSDLSGPEVVSGFETYVTGYPVTDLRKYALARTWYAPEMKRPGCVWTHTLLIDFADLAQIEDLRLLLHYFKRPLVNAQNWLENYQGQITADLDNNAAKTLNNSGGDVSDSYATGILRGLYEEPEKCVVLLAPTAETYQDFILCLWSQQWPRLRRAFSFTSGALSLRQGEETSSFDLQVIPRDLQKQLQHVLREDLWFVVDSTDVKNNVSWCANVIDDLKVASKTKLRDFLWRSGAHLKERRAAFIPLMRIFERLSHISGDELELLVDLLAELFPKPEKAAALKNALLGVTPFRMATWVPAVTETQILSAITKTPHYSAFDSATLGLDVRAITLMSKDRKGAIQLAESLLEAERTPLAGKYLAGIIRNIDVGELIVLGQRDISFVVDAITVNPELASDVKLWLSLPSQRSQLLARLHNNLGSKAIEAMVPVLLEADANGLANELAHCVSSEILVASFLHWFNQRQAATTNLVREWRQFLSYQQSQVVTWLRQQQPQQVKLHTSLLLIELLSPHDRPVVQLGAELWERVAAELEIIQDDYLQQRVAAFLLALGFHNPSPSGARLVSTTFASVYLAARESRLDERNWSLLRDQVPSDWFWDDWDKCARLACSLLEHFVRHGWLETFFTDAIADDEMWNTVSKCSKKRRYWREYFKHAVAALG